eukprot:Rmarinus@m.17699
MFNNMGLGSRDPHSPLLHLWASSTSPYGMHAAANCYPDNPTILKRNDSDKSDIGYGVDDAHFVPKPVSDDHLPQEWRTFKVNSPKMRESREIWHGEHGDNTPPLLLPRSGRSQTPQKSIPVKCSHSNMHHGASASNVAENQEACFPASQIAPMWSSRHYSSINVPAPPPPCVISNTTVADDSTPRQLQSYSSLNASAVSFEPFVAPVTSSQQPQVPVSPGARSHPSRQFTQHDTTGEWVHSHPQHHTTLGRPHAPTPSSAPPLSPAVAAALRGCSGPIPAPSFSNRPAAAAPPVAVTPFAASATSTTPTTTSQSHPQTNIIGHTHALPPLQLTTAKSSPPAVIHPLQFSSSGPFLRPPLPSMGASGQCDDDRTSSSVGRSSTGSCMISGTVSLSFPTTPSATPTSITPATTPGATPMFGPMHAPHSPPHAHPHPAELCSSGFASSLSLLGVYSGSTASDDVEETGPPLATLDSFGTATPTRSGSALHPDAFTTPSPNRSIQSSSPTPPVVREVSRFVFEGIDYDEQGTEDALVDAFVTMTMQQPPLPPQPLVVNPQTLLSNQVPPCPQALQCSPDRPPAYTQREPHPSSHAHHHHLDRGSLLDHRPFPDLSSPKHRQPQTETSHLPLSQSTPSHHGGQSQGGALKGNSHCTPSQSVSDLPPRSTDRAPQEIRPEPRRRKSSFDSVTSSANEETGASGVSRTSASDAAGLLEGDEGGCGVKISQAAAEAKAAKRAELVESPATKLKFKDFFHQFREKEKDGFEAALEYCKSCFIELPEKIHWRIFREMADLFKRESRLDEARCLYESVVQAQPLASQGWLEYAKLEEECGCHERCEEILLRGLACCPYTDGLVIKAVKHFEKQGKLPAARAVLSRLQHLSVEKAWKMILEGALMEARAGNTEMARNVFRYLTAHVSWYGPVYYEAIKFEERCENYEAALRIVEAALQKAPKYGPLWFLALRLHEKICKGDRTRIREVQEQAVSCIPRELVWKVYFETAQVEERWGDIEACRQLYVKCALQCPNNLRWKVWAAGARSELNHGNFEVARELVRRALLEVGRKNVSGVLLEWSRLEEYAGNVDRARDILRRALQEHKSDWKLYLELVLLELRAGNVTKAVNVADQALKIHPDTGRLWAIRIHLAYVDGLAQQCRLFHKAWRTVPKSGEVWCEGARLYLNPYSPYFSLKKASDCLMYAMQFTPQYGDSIIEVVRLRLLAEGPDTDLSDLKMACINADPNYGTAWFHCKSHPLQSPQSVLDVVQDRVWNRLADFHSLYTRAMVRRSDDGTLDMPPTGLANDSPDDNSTESLKLAKTHEGETATRSPARRRRSRPEASDVPVIEGDPSVPQLLTSIGYLYETAALSDSERMKLIFGSDQINL